MSDWMPDYLLAHNLSPKPSTFYNKPDPCLAVGIEDALRYLANTHHAIAETNRLCSEAQLHDNRLEVDPDPNTPSSISQEIGHQPTPPHFHMYLDPLVPTNPKNLRHAQGQCHHLLGDGYPQPNFRSPITQDP